MELEPEQVIWVDDDMKRCKPTHTKARRAVYNKQYELYVIDKPKLKDFKETFEPYTKTK